MNILYIVYSVALFGSLHSFIDMDYLYEELNNPSIETLNKLVKHFRMSDYVSKNTNLWSKSNLKCLEIDDLCKNLSIANCDLSANILSKQDFNKMVPGLVVTSLKKSCKTDSSSFYNRNKSAVWGYSFGFISLINLCALTGILFTPLLNKKNFDLIILLAISLAVGILSSNSLFNLIPEAFGFDPCFNDDFLNKSLLIILSIYFFHAFEVISKIVFIATSKTTKIGEIHNHGSYKESQTTEINHLDVINKRNIYEKESSFADTSMECNKGNSRPKIAMVAWLIILGDAVHNFADGLAIGSSFCSSIQDGVATSISVFLEELPHEIGDFALLLNSGMTLRQAAFWNFISACSCYIGNIIGILAGSMFNNGTQYISAFAGGLFLYISFVNILPECMEKCTHLSNGDWKRMSLYSFLSFLTTNIGVIFMFLTAKYCIFT